MSFKFTKSNLNFDVYTVASKPTTPGENNDIAIITSVPMPNWIMSPDKPSGRPRSDGDVWIQYSVSGNTFNALKNNSVMIATISAWQYVDGAWAEVEAVSCQNGEWVKWSMSLFDNGEQCNSITGGWNGDVGNTINVYGNQTNKKNAHPSNAIDLTGYKKLYAEASVTNAISGSWSIAVILTKTKPASTNVAANEEPLSNNIGFAGTHTSEILEIDLTNVPMPVYISCCGHPNGGNGQFSKIWAK